MFSSISSCGTLRFAPCKVTLHGRGPCLIAFLLVAAFPVGFPPTSCQKRPVFPKVPYREFISAVAESIFQFLGLRALIFFILALCAFISFRFGLLGLHFSFSASILAFGASRLPLRALRGGILWLFVSFWAFRGVSFCSLRLFEPSGGYPSQLRAADRGGPVAKNGPFSQGPIQRI